ncbi:DNA repair protein RecN [Bartonella sp. HY329]|uniref:DNA repair protein RecN n=1 Tax=unclassified Bartonella TaxID=2645622 RepID=UPI0021C5C7BE|nr:MULTISPECIES: DNA repair protein RecN [unclassified Bartonella]UXM94612.1 DNA repair protein RecN [Bartonella sp. HY329]UXN08935.1 DNA repair protein RecN [Bartonella sp. HY328]
MLIQLSIRDIVLIEKLDINFDVGLSVLTGETGAGKSILLDSLSLALGARGDASLVRHGAQQGQVTAVFDVPINHPARLLIRENDLDDDGDIILRRVQSSDGRSRVFINDQVASVGLIKDVGRHLVEIHGQHADRALIDINAHRDLLDAFGGLGSEVSALKQKFQIWRSLEKGLARHRAHVEAAAKEADYLRSSVEELSLLDPQFGEEEFLAERRGTMMKSEKIASDINEAGEILSGPTSAVPILANLVRRLERKMSEAQDIVEPIIQQVDQALDALGLAQDAVENAMRIIDFDPRELETVEERLFALRAAARKYSVAVENLPELRDKLDANLADLDAGETTLTQMEAETLAARDAFDVLAQELSQKRKDAAHQLEAAVMAELPALKLERAKFIIEFTTNQDERQLEGIDTVEFYVQTNPGTKPGPMMKVASGGELSRFLLALKVALADRGSAPTLVFDEIDTGVGGAVADAIGQRLKRLAQNVQVLSVTHAPQVAARADGHFLIAKAETGDSDRVSSRIHLMDKKERQEEIARMLAGAEVTSEARAAAKKLLASKD